MQSRNAKNVRKLLEKYLRYCSIIQLICFVHIIQSYCMYFEEFKGVWVAYSLTKQLSSLKACMTLTCGNAYFTGHAEGEVLVKEDTQRFRRRIRFDYQRRKRKRYSTSAGQQGNFVMIRGREHLCSRCLLWWSTATWKENGSATTKLFFFNWSVNDDHPEAQYRNWELESFDMRCWWTEKMDRQSGKRRWL